MDALTPHNCDAQAGMLDTTNGTGVPDFDERAAAFRRDECAAEPASDGDDIDEATRGDLMDLLGACE